MTPTQWDDFIKQHGGQAGDPAILNPKILNPDGSGQQIDNPNPHMRYTFKDGTSLVVQNGPSPGTDGVDSVPGVPGKIIVSGGTAYKPAASTKTTGPQYFKGSNGIEYKYDPTTGVLTPLVDTSKAPPPKEIAGPPSEKELPIQNPDGSITWVPNSNYDQAAADAKVADTKAKTAASTAAAANSTAKAAATTAATDAGTAAANVAKTQEQTALLEEQRQLDIQKQNAISPYQQQTLNFQQASLDYRKNVADNNAAYDQKKIDLATYQANVKKAFDDTQQTLKQQQLTNQVRGQDVNLLDTELRASGNIADMAVRSPAMNEVVRGLVTPSAMAAYNANTGSLQQGAGITPTPIQAGPVPDLGNYGIHVAMDALKGLSPLAAQIMGQGVTSNGTANANNFTTGPAMGQAGKAPVATNPNTFVAPPMSSAAGINSATGTPFGLGNTVPPPSVTPNQAFAR